jgi:WhiB family redox-sensing transcriptional regulator
VSAAAVDLGPRQAAVLAHLAEHPGLTATELCRAFGLRASLYRQLGRLEQMALVVGVPVWNPGQGRQVTRWRVAPPGTVPPPPAAPDPEAYRRRLERDRKSQAARRARARELAAVIGTDAPSLRDLLGAAACRSADPGLFFGPDAEFVTARRDRVAQARAICAGCPVRDACLAYALDTGQYGIWGGADEDERRAMLRQRRAS